VYNWMRPPPPPLLLFAKQSLRQYRAGRERLGPGLGGIRADSSERENYESTGEKLQHVEILLASPFANEVDVRQFRSPPNPHPKAFQSRGPGQSIKQSLPPTTTPWNFQMGRLFS
jgi:hypothetical protein